MNASQYFTLQIKSLKLCGVWFFIPHSTKRFRFWLNILVKIFIALLIFLIPTSAQLLYVIKLIITGKAEIQEIAGILNLAITEVQVHLRLYDLFLRRHALKKVIDEIVNKDFQFHLKPQSKIFEKTLKLSKKLFWVLFISGAIDIIVHVIVVPGLHNFKILPLKMHLIWLDVEDEQYFKYIFAYQILYKPIIFTTFIAIQTFPWAAMLFAIGQLDILIWNLENIKMFVRDSKKPTKKFDHDMAFREVFKRFVLHHCAIIRYIKALQEAFSGQFTAIMCFNAIIICTTAVQIMSIDSPSHNITDLMWIIAFLSIFIGNLFIDCYFSNAVTIKSLKVSTTVYFCPWVDMPGSFKKNIILFIARTQDPVVLTAAKIVPVSLDTFTKIMNWTYKGVALMNSMKK